MGASSLKLAITTDDGLTQCYVEVEKWDNGSNRATLHFLAPTLSSTNVNYFYLYYDSSQADNSTYVGVIGSTPGKAVWDSNYKAVCHCAEDPTGTVQDSTSNGNDFLGSGMASGDLVYDTVLGHWCLDFDGGNDYLRSNSNGFNPQSQAYSQEFIYKKDATAADDFNLLSQEDGGGTGRSLVTIDANSTDKFYTYVSGGATYSIAKVVDSNWDAVGFMQSGSNNMDFYMHGELDRGGVSVTPASMSGRWVIGSHKLHNQQWFDGRIAEFRISDIERTAAWHKATVDSYFDRLHTWYEDTEDESTSAQWHPNYDKRITFTIDSSLVDSDLTDFPVTLQVTSSSGISAVDLTAFFDELSSDANRKKIAVTDSDGITQLPVEIDYFSFSSELAVLHVKVPSVPSTYDKKLYLYYDSSAEDNDLVGDIGDAIAQSVWDTYEVVLHMSQDPTGWCRLYFG